MQIYHYHSETGESLGSSEARGDEKQTEIDGKTRYLIPANATDIQPPDVAIGSVAIFADDAWQIVEDHRGEVWYGAQGAETKIKNLGPIPAGLTIDPPPPTAAALAQAKIDELEASVTPRRMREAVLTAAGTVWLQDIEDQIVVERARL